MPNDNDNRIRLYAISMWAQREEVDEWDETAVQTRIIPTYCRAHSAAEAEGFGIQDIRKRLPIRSKWINHGANVIEIDDSFVMDTAADIPVAKTKKKVRRA